MLSLIKNLIPSSVMLWYHYALATLASFVFNNPSQNMVVIGVTGTNGKSTVIELLRSIFESVGLNAASLSSIRSVINEEETMNMLKMTMPGRFAIQRFLHNARARGVSHVVLEATSEGIRQFRHRGIDWDGLVFTNLAPEHIESHGSFEEYKKAKETLFEYLSHTARKGRTKKIIVVNADDPFANDFLQYGADEKWAYAPTRVNASRMASLLHKKTIDELEQTASAFLAPESFDVSEKGISLLVEGFVIESELQGEFNVYNILAAVTLARAYGIEWKAIQHGIEKVTVIPGRLEYIQKEPFKVIVDYAHTPDALRKVYQFLRKNQESRIKNQENYKLICVLGAAGGGRDTWKRPEFGKIAAEFCDEIIVTNEDPYDENPASILDEIEAGFSQAPNSKNQIPNTMKILDRGEAIRKAVSDAKSGDTVIITGKGSEQWIAGKDVLIPWDDREVAREALTK